MLVQSPGSLLRNNLVCRNLEIYINGVKFPTSLIIIDSNKLDVILGMNWLTQYQVCISCATREVTVKNMEGRTTSFYARKRIPTKDMVFAAVTEEVELIPVVSEYPDVFPEELPGMLPDRDIEFLIEFCQVQAQYRSDRTGCQQRIWWKLRIRLRSYWIKVTFAQVLRLGDHPYF